MREEYKSLVIEKTENFYREQIAILNSYNLESFHNKYNPVLFLLIGHDLETAVKKFVAAKIQASMETKVGHLYEQIAVSISGGKPEAWIEGVDGDVRRIIDGEKYRFLIAIKSGAFWSNANSTKAQKLHFDKAKEILEEPDVKIMSMMGICTGYGRPSTKPAMGADIQLEGDYFWQFITGEKDFYYEMVCIINEVCEKMGHQLELAEQQCQRRIFSEIKYRSKKEFVQETHFQKESKKRKNNDEFVEKMLAEAITGEYWKNLETSTVQLEFDFQ